MEATSNITDHDSKLNYDYLSQQKDSVCTAKNCSRNNVKLSYLTVEAGNIGSLINPTINPYDMSTLKCNKDRNSWCNSNPMMNSNSMQEQLLNLVNTLVQTFINIASQLLYAYQNLLNKPPVVEEPQLEAPLPDTTPITKPVTPESGATSEINIQSTPKTQANSLVPVDAKILKATGEMTWNPNSEKTNKGVIKFRDELKGKISSVQILSPDGTSVIGNITSKGLNKDGQPFYRIDQSGADLPNGSIVLVKLKSGESRYIEIPNPSKSFKY